MATVAIYNYSLFYYSSKVGWLGFNGAFNTNIVLQKTV